MTPLSAQTIFEQTVELERRIDVTLFRIEGVDMWWQVRDHLIMTEYRRMDGAVSGHGYLARVVAKLPLIPVVVREEVRLRWQSGRSTPVGQSNNAGPVDVLVLGDESSRRLRQQGRWYDVFLDPVLDEVEARGLSTHVMLLNRAGVVRRPGYRPAESLSGHMVRQYIHSSVGAWRLRIPATFNAAYKALRREAVLVGAQDRLLSLSALCLEAAYTIALMRWCSARLDALQPRAIFMAPYASYAGRAMCVAARARGIPVVDVQHGVQGRLHSAYARFPVVPGGLTVMPTHYFTWTAEDHATISEWASPSGLYAYEIGNPLLNQFLSNGPVARDTDLEVLERLGPGNGETRILVTLSWWGDVPEEFLAVMEASPPSYRFLVRLHPGSASTHQSRIVAQLSSEPLRSRCEWDAASDLPLYGLLRRVDAHLTLASTIVLEAETFGVRSVIAGERGREYFAGPLARGAAVWATGRDGILAALARCVAERMPPADPSGDSQSHFQAVIRNLTEPRN